MAQIFLLDSPPLARTSYQCLIFAFAYLRYEVFDGKSKATELLLLHFRYPLNFLATWVKLRPWNGWSRSFIKNSYVNFSSKCHHVTYSDCHAKTLPDVF